MNDTPAPPTNAAAAHKSPLRIPLSAPVLVVDDSSVDRRLVGSIVERYTDCRIAYASDGVEALAAMESERPSVVLTDLKMPHMDGLKLVEAVRARFVTVPVVLMTAEGSEEIAFQALQRGAAGYVLKKNLPRELARTLLRVVAAADLYEGRARAFERIVHNEFEFCLENDATLVPHVLALLQENFAGMRLGDCTDQIRVRLGLEEALLNAMYHGNLRLGSELRLNEEEFQKEAEARRRQPPYTDRKVYLTARMTRTEAVFIVRDQGFGFPWAQLPDPADPASLKRVEGRGLLLIRTFMDEVTHNTAGNEITMIKRASPQA